MESKIKSFVESIERKLHRTPSMYDLVNESLNRQLSSKEFIELLKEIDIQKITKD